ncbi:MAG: SDR family oxidoreductase [Proteobacteria bacterium]|nr:SDR family oxidoreductase [Pseudomonadota bacterium]
MNPNQLFSLSGKVALVTGATKGIGKSIAETFAAAGSQVIVSSRDQGRCDAVAAEINGAGGEALGIACNISHKDQLRGLVDKSLAAFGKIDVLVCNAAVNPHFGPLAEISQEAYDKIMNTNVGSNLWLCNMVIPGMAERRDGAVIIISSIGGLKGSEKLGAYGLSKAADMQLARNFAVEWGHANVRVNCIAPGLIKTDFARALWEDPEAAKRAVAAYPIGRLGEPDDIAGAALFLAGRAGSFVTGHTLVVDGGSTIGGVRYS